MQLLVVGAGEMGRWFADALAVGLADPPTVAFTDTDDDAARAAAADAADALDARSVPTDADERFDAVCFAVPIPALDAAVDDHAAKAERALVDVTGVMAPALAAMQAAAPTCERVSFHPLFAAANAPGTVAVVPDATGPVTDRISDGLTAAGNDLFETTAREHDEAMETVQASAHAAILAFGLAAEDVREEFQTPVSAGLFDLLDQVTGNDPRVYADIQSAFDGADEVAAAAREFADADRAAFDNLYRDANPRDRSGTPQDREETPQDRDGESGAGR